MALCTVCSMDPCPHLKTSGGSAGAPAATAGPKYAPSSKPHCPSCDRVHRNIGTDNQPVCAWRTYSKAKGEDFVAFTPEAVEEFARWFRAGGWTAPARKTKAAKSATATPTAVGMVSGATVVLHEGEVPTAMTAETPSITIPSFAELEDTTPAEAISEAEAIVTEAQAPAAVTEVDLADALAAL